MTDFALDCLVVGAGPAGLASALYLARFRRRFAIVDAGEPRAAWIPTSHNIPFFERGIGGREIFARQRTHVERYGTTIVEGTVTSLARRDGGFVATVQAAEGERAQISAQRILLASGAVDVEPEIPDIGEAVRRGLVRYCPICDGYEAKDRRIAVFGRTDHALAEAVFIARTYPSDITVLKSGGGQEWSAQQRDKAVRHGIKLIDHAIDALETAGDGVCVRAGGAAHRFDVLYAALGLRYRTDLAAQLGADRDASGALHVDDHNQTSVAGLYAAGDAVRGLAQIAVGLGHAAIAATHIHNTLDAVR